MAPPECLKLCGSRLISRAEATSSYGSRTRHSPTAVEVAGRGPKLPFAIQAWGGPKILGRSLPPRNGRLTRSSFEPTPI